MLAKNLGKRRRSSELIEFVDSKSAPGNLGATFRRTRPGPELDLVESFLIQMPLEIPRGCQATVFREPMIESGFPDLVIVVWNRAAALKWSEERALLHSQDMRVMHFLHQAGSKVADEELFRLFRRPTHTLERLERAGMVRRLKGGWSARALSWAFAAKKIIAVEAKVDRWAEVIDQAVLNTWFASTSYVLIPRRPTQQLRDVARKFGIGICSMEGEQVEEVSTPPEALPRSYASWLFNDLAWRTSL